MTTDADEILGTITLFSRFQEPIEEIMRAVLEDGHDLDEIAIAVMTESCSITDQYIKHVPSPFSRYVRIFEGCAVFMCMKSYAISASMDLYDHKEEMEQSFSKVSKGSAAIVFLAEKVTVAEYSLSDESSKTRVANPKMSN